MLLKTKLIGLFALLAVSGGVQSSVVTSYVPAVTLNGQMLPYNRLEVNSRGALGVTHGVPGAGEPLLFRAELRRAGAVIGRWPSAEQPMVQTLPTDALEPLMRPGDELLLDTDGTRLRCLIFQHINWLPLPGPGC